MTSPTYQEAITVQTSDEIRDVTLIPAIEAGGSDVAGWPDIAPQRGLVEGNARALAHAQAVRAQIAKTKSPEDCLDAGDDWVDARTAWYRPSDGAGGYGRIRATRSTWDVPLKVTVAAAPLTIDGSTKITIQADDGTYFESAQASAVSLSAGTSYKGTVRFQARAPGTSGNVAPGSFASIISGPAGLSLDGTGTPALVTAARDDETSAALLERALAKWATRGAGWTDDAFDVFVPLAAPTVTRWRVRGDAPLGLGTVAVILANAAGGATAPEVAAVQALLGSRAVKPWGSGRFVALAAADVYELIEIELEGDGSNPTLAADATAALEALRDALPLGPVTVELDVMRAVAIGASFDEITVTLGDGTTKTIRPPLPGFHGAVSIVSWGPMTALTVPTDGVSIAEFSVTA